MSIRKRLALSFIAILALFGINVAIYFWSAHLRHLSVVDLQTAVQRQTVLASLEQKLGDIQKEVALLSQVMVESGGSGAAPEQVADFEKRLKEIEDDARNVHDSLSGHDRQRATELLSGVLELNKSWQGFYRNFGGPNHTRAVAELVTRAEPLSHRVLQQTVPRLQDEEKTRVHTASANFYRVAAVTGRISIGIFIASTLIAAFVAFLVSRHLANGLNLLRQGAELIGAGAFNHRIPITSGDELGVLAIAYNEMAESLYEARKEMTHANVQLERQNQALERERQMSEQLLLNILPNQVARELKENGLVEPKYFEDATILFTDFVGFTLSTEHLAAEKLVSLLHEYFTAFDNITSRYYLEKLKTIGDAYMCAAGLPVGRRARRAPSHPVDAVMAAMEMVQAVTEISERSPAKWGVRIGLNTGPVIAGVVGIQKFAFDIWGDTVNFASRVESAGVKNQVNISERTYSRVKDFFVCEHRGKIATKEKKEYDMYLVKGVHDELIDDPTQNPPPAFHRRYRIYFQKEPPAFPAFLLHPEARVTAAAAQDQSVMSPRLSGDE